MSSTNEPYLAADDGSLTKSRSLSVPPSHSKVDNSSGVFQRCATTTNFECKARTPFEPVKPKRTSSKLRKLAVRQGVLQKLFFPHHDHKKYLMDKFVKHTEGASEDEFHSGQLDARGKIVWFIHSKTVQTILLLLLLVDVFIVIAELIISGLKECHLYVQPYSNNGLCMQGISIHSHGHGFHALAGGGYHAPPVPYGATNSSGYFPPENCGVKSDLVLSHGLHTAETVLFYISVVILCIFALELLVLFACLCHRFFTVVYVVDAIIVGVSLALSFTLNEHDAASVGTLIFIRCWRFARILHGAGLTIHEAEEIIDEGGEEKEHDPEAVEKQLKSERELQVVTADACEMAQENKHLRKLLMQIVCGVGHSHEVVEDLRKDSHLLQEMQHELSRQTSDIPLNGESSSTVPGDHFAPITVDAPEK